MLFDPLETLRHFYIEREIRYTIVRSPEDLSSRKDRPIHYLLAGNGVFIAARNEVFTVRNPVASGNIKGLLPIEERFELRIPKMPAGWIDTILRWATWYAE